FLVDSVGMAINARKLDTHAVLHPVLHVERDAEGGLVSTGGSEGTFEAVLHFEIDRITDAAEGEAPEEQVRHMLGDVRSAVRDWKPMREKALQIADDLGVRKLPVDGDSVAEAQDFLRWVADDHFTFLGYREYEVAEADGEEVLRAVEGSGLGILHASERSVAPRSLSSLAATQLHQSG